MEHEPTIVRNDGAGRFELATAPEQGQLSFQQDEGRLTLVHTEVADDLEGQGVASALIRAALDHAEREGLTVVPECPFVANWLERHPDRASELDIADA